MADLIVPKLGESISEALIAKWLKNVGDTLAVDEPVVELETDKVSIAIPAPQSGVLTEQRFPVGATVQVGAVVGVLTPGQGAQKAPGPQKAAPKAVTPPITPAPTQAVQATPGAPHRTLPPSVRKAMREGGEARVEAEHHTPDLIPAVSSANANAGASARVVAGPDEEVVAMTPLRKRIAERLVEAQHSAAILTTFNEVDMTNVMALRARYQEEFTEKHGIKLGFMSFFARACVEALKAFPGLNAEVRGANIVYKRHYDLGIAVGSGKGLVVPVVRGIDKLGFHEIEQRIADLALRARNNQLTLDELSGGTFSITNGGIYGSMMSTPLLNMPQTGILGMHNIIKRPIAVDDTIAVRPMMYLALSYDHRVVDGREAVQFLIGVKERIEAPDRLLLQL
jgi:2-oxoglutarate dehydrogenase E2 component (dihydrolipoamide succinyltransferase)